MTDGPRPIGPSIDEVLGRVLPEPVAKERVRLLSEHADAVLRLRDHFREVCVRRLEEVARELVEQGWNEMSAEQIAGVRLEEEIAVMRQELEEQLDVLKDRLRKSIRRLCEAWGRGDAGA